MNRPAAPVATNQRDSQMTYAVDDPGDNPHVSHEPSITGGLREASGPGPGEQGPRIGGRLTWMRLPRSRTTGRPASATCSRRDGSGTTWC